MQFNNFFCFLAYFNIIVFANRLQASTLKRMFAKTLAGSVLCTSLFVPNVYATEASKLFAEAEESLQVTKAAYKGLDNEWSNTKKYIVDNSRNLGKATELIKGFETDINQLTSQTQKVVSDTGAAISTIQGEIDGLGSSTAQKYAAAKVAEESGAPLGKIQGLFRSAEDEAAVLVQDQKVLKGFQDVIQGEAAIKKLEKVSADMKDILVRADTVQIEQGNGLALLINGYTTNADACAVGGPKCSSKEQDGSPKVEKGVAEVNKAQDRFLQIAKDFDADLIEIRAISVNTDRAYAKVKSLLDDVNLWEKESKLRLKNGKQLLTRVSESLEKDAAAATRTLNHFLEVDSKLSGKEGGDGSLNGSKIKQLRDALRSTTRHLEEAEKSGRKTEKLLKFARTQGDIEASVYLKYSQPDLPATTASYAKR